MESLVKGATSLDKIVVRSSEPTDNPVYFHMVHVEIESCRVSRGQTVSRGESLCRWFTSNEEEIKCPNGDSICWNGAHIHVYAQNSSGNITNLHQLIGVDLSSCD